MDKMTAIIEYQSYNSITTRETLLPQGSVPNLIISAVILKVQRSVWLQLGEIVKYSVVCWYFPFTKWRVEKITCEKYEAFICGT